MKPPLIALALVTMLTQACVYHDLDDQAPNSVDCEDTSIAYTDEIVPLIKTKCALSGCHDGSSGLPNWNIISDLQEYGGEIQRRTQLPSTDPDHMPRVGSLSEAEKKLIYCWIENGAQGD